MTTALVCLLAVLLDTWLGDPQRAHPLGYFLRWADRVEARVRRLSISDRKRGALALVAAVVPFVIAATLLAQPERLGLLTEVLLLYLALGVGSVAQKAENVATALEAGNLSEAQAEARWMLGTQAGQMDAGELAAGTLSTVLKNGNDAGFGPLFWYVLGGAGGVVLFRLVDTLDRIWGCRDPGYGQFGWSTARLDDLLGWLPARLGALTYGLLGDGPRAWRGWRKGAGTLAGLNAGPLVAAGAGAIRVELPESGPGEGMEPTLHHLRRAIQLVQHSLWFWMVTIVALDLILF